MKSLLMVIISPRMYLLLGLTILSPVILFCFIWWRYELNKILSERPFLFLFLASCLSPFIVVWWMLPSRADLLVDFLVNLSASIMFTLISIFVVEAIISGYQKRRWEEVRQLIEVDVAFLSNKVVSGVAEALGLTVLNYNITSLQDGMDTLFGELIEDLSKDLPSRISRLNEYNFTKLMSALKIIRATILEVFIIGRDNLSPNATKFLLKIKYGIDQWLLQDEIKKTAISIGKQAQAQLMFDRSVSGLEVVTKDILQSARSLHAAVVKREEGGGK